MEEAVRLDLEYELAGWTTPLGGVDPAAVIVIRRRRSLNRKGAKAVLANQPRGRGVQRSRVKGMMKGELRSTSKGGLRLVVGANVIAVLARRGAVPRVEV